MRYFATGETFSKLFTERLHTPLEFVHNRDLKISLKTNNSSLIDEFRFCRTVGKLSACDCLSKAAKQLFECFKLGILGLGTMSTSKHWASFSKFPRKIRTERVTCVLQLINTNFPIHFGLKLMSNSQNNARK